MNLSDFNTNLMTTKIIFDEALIKPGDVITLYRIDATAKEDTSAKFVRNALIEECTSSLIKYTYYDSSNEEMGSGYLYSSMIFVPPVTEAQWEDTDSLFIFKITSGDGQP